MQLRSALRYVRHTPLHPQWLLDDRKIFVDWAVAHARGVVLDIGCADQWIKPHLHGATRYIGVDYWDTGQKLYKARPDVFADAACLPLAAQSCDTVILLEVLEHIRHPQNALHEIARVLRPGGSLLLSMPFLYPIHDAPHDYQRLTRHGLQRDVMEAGLEVVSIDEKLSALETAAVLGCLAMGGAVVEALRGKKVALVMAPLLLALIPVVNMLGWLGARIFPNWPALGSGYRLLARKPGADKSACSEFLPSRE
jgi:SAM-dependent methyltransferase